MKSMAKQIFMALVALFVSVGVYAGDGGVVYAPEDSVEVVKLLSEAKGKAATPLYFAKKLLGRPYVGHTLEVNGNNEKLVVNLRELDCTTLVESATALAMAAKKGDATFDAYCRCLRLIRYRGGDNSGYASRLHYFSQWIDDNCRKGIVSDIGAGGDFPFTARQTINVYFMTRNPKLYRQLDGNVAMQKEIAGYEAQINGRVVNYIPKNLLKLGRDKLGCIHDGDIIALVTSKAGLDISHVGIAAWKNGKLHLLNASSLQHKVVLDRQSLYDYQKSRASQLGIRVVRLR